MSMRDDFYMYYGDSWISVKRDGKLLPFYIDGTRHVGEYDEEDHYYYANHAEALAATTFCGTLVVDESGRTESFRINGADPALVLEPQDLGYIKMNGQWVWNTFTTYYSVKKGLTTPRMYVRNSNNSTYFKLFNIEPDGVELLHRDVVLYDNKLEYKGAVVGTKDGNTISVTPEYALFIPWFSGLIPSCQIVQA